VLWDKDKKKKFILDSYIYIYMNYRKGQPRVHVAPACVGSGEGSIHIQNRLCQFIQKQFILYSSIYL
jgi:hypothetical protein